VGDAHDLTRLALAAVEQAVQAPGGRRAHRVKPGPEARGDAGVGGVAQQAT
jgi:hypothetical protein